MLLYHRKSLAYRSCGRTALRSPSDRGRRLAPPAPLSPPRSSRARATSSTTAWLCMAPLPRRRCPGAAAAVSIRNFILIRPLYLSSCFSRFGVTRLLGHFQDFCHSSAGCPLASPERVARRGSQWAGSARRRVLPFCGFRPFRTGRAKGSGATERPLRLEHLGGTSASVPGHDGRPVGSLHLERQYRDRRASWRPVGTTDLKECRGRT